MSGVDDGPEPGGDDGLERLDALAAEHVLGTLDGETRLLFDRLLERDEGVRALVVGWEARLQGLADAAARTPPPALRERVVEAVRLASGAADGTNGVDAPRPRVPEDPMPVEAQIDIDLLDRPAAAVPVDSGSGAEPGGPGAPVPAPRRIVVERRPAEAANESGWRAATLAASIIAASLLALLVGQILGVPGARDGATDDAPGIASIEPPAADPATTDSATAAAPTALSLLRDAEGRPRYLVEIDEADASVRITALDADPVASDASLQLWMADGASGELRPIGLLPTDPWSSLQLERVPLVTREPAFAVSEEPPGGSPGTGPTGAVVFEGTVHPLGDAD